MVTIVPNVTNWSVTPQNGQVGYFTLMNTWLFESTTVISSLNTAITKINEASSDINEIGTNAINAIMLDTIEDLATYTGTGLVMIKDINRGGTFVSKTAIEIDPNTGSLYVANGGTVFAKLGGGFWVRRYSGAVNVKWFGAKGDGRLKNGNANPNATDDTVAIQNAITFARKNNILKVVGEPNACYKTSSTIYIPTTYRRPAVINRELQFIIDWCGAEFLGTTRYEEGGYACFESAYFDSNDNLVSTIDAPNDYYLTTGTQIINCRLSSYFRGFNLKGWIYGCKVSNIFCEDVSQAVKAIRCFYTHFNQIICRGLHLDSIPRFHFHDNNNIMPITGCTSGICDIAFRITGFCEALRLVDCGIEGFNIGVQTDEVFNIKFDSCYFETGNAGTIGYEGGSVYADKVTFTNCYINGSIKMIGTIPNKTRIIIDDNNHIRGGAIWYDENLNANSLIMERTSNRSLTAGTLIPMPLLPKSANVRDVITIYDNNYGIADGTVGKVENTSLFHAQKVNGKFSNGFSGTNRKGVGYVYTENSTISNTRTVTFETNISWSDCQNIYVALKIAHWTGTWIYYANIYGSTVVTHFSSGGTGSITVTNVSGKVVITTPALPANLGTAFGVTSGEIRLI